MSPIDDDVRVVRTLPYVLLVLFSAWAIDFLATALTIPASGPRTAGHIELAISPAEKLLLSRALFITALSLAAAVLLYIRRGSSRTPER